MRFPRSAGVLLHVSSLPAPHGVGDLGEAALGFLDFLAAGGQSWWQVLPLGPSDDGNPYVAQSSWAGAPWLVSLDALARAGDLDADDLARARVPDAPLVDYGEVVAARTALLPRAAARFFARDDREERARFEAFSAAEAGWLDDWALFAAAKKRFGGLPWWEWPAEAALRTDRGLAALRRELADAARAERYVQFRFFEQWDALREAARARGIGFIGDVPIYCARDSADVWAARDHFQLDAAGRPLAVSGVPPDYFSEDGQLWGHPLYHWPRHLAEGFAWWLSRLRGALRLADVVRIDHFRGLESYWEVAADAPSAKTGRWVEAPGDALFEAVRAALGKAPFIAEDLGLITPEVHALRDRWQLPGMRVLQFAFSDQGESTHIPFRHERNCVVYTGTHDNDTAVGWYETLSEEERDFFRRFTASDGTFCHWHLMRAAYGSVADLAVVPMQDVLGLGSEARMNTPGVPTGNWRWKLVPGQATSAHAATLRDLAGTFGRARSKRPEE